jgi:hypothetical protein
VPIAPLSHLSARPDLDGAVRTSWGLDTCDDVDAALWTPQSPERGHCGVTALVLQDHLGGELLLAEVSHADGSRQGVHYWNRLLSGEEVDLTRTQFDKGEALGPARVQQRPPGLAPKQLAHQYDLLSRRVLTYLEGASRAKRTTPTERPS